MTASSSRQGGPPPTSSFSSSSISATVTNVDPHLESQPTTSQVGYVRRLIDQAGITPAVLAHQYAGKGTEEEPYVVDFLSEDPYNPMKMSQRRKWTYMMLQALACLGVTLVSTGYSGGAFDVIVSFGVSTTVAILGVSLCQYFPLFLSCYAFLEATMLTQTVCQLFWGLLLVPYSGLHSPRCMDAKFFSSSLTVS